MALGQRHQPVRGVLLPRPVRIGQVPLLCTEQRQVQASRDEQHRGQQDHEAVPPQDRRRAARLRTLPDVVFSPIVAKAISRRRSADV